MVSIETICAYTGFARATVVAALKILEETKEIKRSKCWRGIRTKIVNFDKYQDNGSSESSIVRSSKTELLIEPQSELQTELLIEPEQELKKDKKEKNKIDANASTSGAAAPDHEMSSQESVDFVGLMKFFNRTMEEAGAIIPRCKSCDGKRREFVRARIREHGLDAVYEMITKASQSDFLNGKSRSGWIADFTWLFRPSNFQKVLEGNYDNRTNYNGQQNNQPSTGSNPKNTVTGFKVIKAGG